MWSDECLLRHSTIQETEVEAVSVIINGFTDNILCLEKINSIIQ